jgi:hypothetical protein
MESDMCRIAIDMDNGTRQTLMCMIRMVSNMLGWVWIGCCEFYAQLIDKRHVPRDEGLEHLVEVPPTSQTILQSSSILRNVAITNILKYMLL